MTHMTITINYGGHYRVDENGRVEVKLGNIKGKRESSLRRTMKAMTSPIGHFPTCKPQVIPGGKKIQSTHCFLTAFTAFTRFGTMD
jgi:hypothetical protein